MHTKFFVIRYILVEDIDTLNNECGRFAILFATFQREKLSTYLILPIEIRLNDTVQIKYAAILNMNTKHIMTRTNVKGKKCRLNLKGSMENRESKTKELTQYCI